MLVVSRPPGNSYPNTSMRLSRNCAGACELLATKETQAVIALRQWLAVRNCCWLSVKTGRTTTRP